jgi:SWI/SNF-related matrix-associated actin-dependent regulator 1 of chromatin subfamily A
MTMIEQTEARVKAAWEETGHNAKAATQLLLDSSWSPKVVPAAPAPAPAPPRAAAPTPIAVPNNETGRVKEVDEANQAARIAQKERGRKSAIYQNRALVEPAKTTPPAKAAVAPVKRLQSPPSPIIVARSRKRVKKVVDSDSDEGYEDSDDEVKPRRRQDDDEVEEDVNEIRALSYLNDAGPEAIQELTGKLHCTMTVIASNRVQ